MSRPASTFCTTGTSVKIAKGNVNDVTRPPTWRWGPIDSTNTHNASRPANLTACRRHSRTVVPAITRMSGRPR